MELPTTPGSIVTFDLPEDSDGVVYRAVATLIPGHIDSDGEAHSMVWASAELDGPDDIGCVFAPDFILASNPRVEVVTRTADERPEFLFEAGTVIRVVENGAPMTYTCAPSFLYEGEMQEVFWTNSYGGYWAQDDGAEPEVLYVPVPADRA